MVDKPTLTQEEWQLLLHLVERERSELPPEIHHTQRANTREHLREQLHLVDGLLQKLRQLAAVAPSTATAQ